MTTSWIHSRSAGRARGLLLALLASVLAASLLLTSASRSLSKPEFERRLRLLEKNATLGELKRATLRADLGDGSQEYELIYHHSPATTPGDPVPIVLVHGTPSTLFSWTHLIHGAKAAGSRTGYPGLNATREVFAIEVIGHGMAPGTDSPINVERCARFVTAAIQALELERVHLVGPSYGGEFAWRAALNEPDLIASPTLFTRATSRSRGRVFPRLRKQRKLEGHDRPGARRERRKRARTQHPPAADTRSLGSPGHRLPARPLTPSISLAKSQGLNW
jgi:pimeloyl-ACP methyl ester carboxylesterase